MIATRDDCPYQLNMHRKFINDPGHVHFLTFSCYHKHQLLTSDRVCTWLAQAIHAAREKHGFALWAYVFMPNHVHLIIHPQRDSYSISKILRDIKEPVAQLLMSHLRKEAPWDLKKLMARQGNREIQRLWQAGGGFDRNLIEWNQIDEKIVYVELNPVRRGLAKESSDWTWSSARARAGDAKVPLSVDPVTIEDLVVQR
jgi:putative transposase